MRADGRAQREDLRDRRASRLARARRRAAFYDEEALAQRLGRAPRALLHAHGQRYQVVPELRQMIVFAPHDVIKDAPFTRRRSHHAAATCSSTCSRAAQQRALAVLPLRAQPRRRARSSGRARARRTSPHDFETDRQALAHLPEVQRRPHPGRDAPAALQERRRAAALRLFPARRRALLGRRTCSGPTTRCSTRSMPPSLLVTEQGELVHAFGGASRFLGRATGDHAPRLVRRRSTTSSGWSSSAGLRRALAQAGPIVFKQRAPRATRRARRRYKVTMRRVRAQDRRGGARPRDIPRSESRDGAPGAPRAGDGDRPRPRSRASSSKRSRPS